MKPDFEKIAKTLSPYLSVASSQIGKNWALNLHRAVEILVDSAYLEGRKAQAKVDLDIINRRSWWSDCAVSEIAKAIESQEIA